MKTTLTTSQALRGAKVHFCRRRRGSSSDEARSKGEGRTKPKMERLQTLLPERHAIRVRPPYVQYQSCVLEKRGLNG